MGEIEQGLTLSGLGILITFSALGILIGLILLLKALFPMREKGEEPEEVLNANDPYPSVEREKLRKQAAAAGVSVLVRSKSRSDQGSLGKQLEDPVSGWWRKGVDRVHRKE